MQPIAAAIASASPPVRFRSQPRPDANAPVASCEGWQVQ
jgi:hypothetical protein